MHNSRAASDLLMNAEQISLYKRSEPAKSTRYNFDSVAGVESSSFEDYLMFRM